MTLAAPRVSWWAAGVAAGVAIALLPLPFALLLLLGLVLAIVFYLEPALCLLVVLCVAPLKALIETEAGFALDVGQLGFAAFLGLWALRYVLDGKPPLKYDAALLVALLIFIFGASFSLWGAYSTATAVRELLKWAQILLLVLVVPNLPRGEWLIWGVVLSAALQALIGLWQFGGGSGAAHLWILDYRFFRAFGTFGQPNPFGGFLGLVLPLALGSAGGLALQGLSTQKDRRGNLLLAVLLAALAGLILLGLLASWSRGAWLGFIGALGVLVWSFPRKPWQGALLISLGVLGVWFLLVVGVLPASLAERLTGFSADFSGFQDVRGAVISNDNFAVIERLAHWQSALEMARQNPWVGVGFGNYENAYAEFALINWRFALGHAHNYYLNLLAETGIIGLITYLVMWAMIAAQTWRSAAQADWQQRGVYLGLLGVWTHITIHHFIDKLYVNNIFLHVGVLFGLLAALRQRKSG